MSLGLFALIFFFFVIVIIIGVPGMGVRVNPLVEVSSRDQEELVKLAGYGEDKLSTVLISGTLVCDDQAPCNSLGKADSDQANTSSIVSDAKVGVACQTSEKLSKLIWVIGTTDGYGEFLIDLPSHLHALPNLDKLCLVKVLSLPENSLCHPAINGKQTGLILSSVGNGIRTYTAAGSLHLKPKTFTDVRK